MVIATREMLTPNPMHATKETARRKANIFRKNPKRASQVIFIIAGAIGLLSVIPFWNPNTSDSILVLRSQNGRLDENETRRAAKTYQNGQKQEYPFRARDAPMAKCKPVHPTEGAEMQR